MHPFDLKTVLLAKHAQHVALIHFPIALFVTGVIFDLIGQWKKRQALIAAAYYNLSMAALSTVPVLITGILAWRWQLEGERLKGMLLMHLVLGCVSALLMWAVWLVHRKAWRDRGAALPAYRLPIEALAVAIVMATGHLGGFLSGVNGT